MMTVRGQGRAESPSQVLHDGIWSDATRCIADEAAIAMTFNRVTHAVMMGTPLDLEDFAHGFALAEGVVASAAAIEALEIVEIGPRALECRMWIAAPAMAALETRRRRLAGVTGCGMCGLESLDAAMRPAPHVPPGGRFTATEIASAVGSLSAAQPLNRATRAVHAAGFWQRDHGLIAVREDVGRHNALDKLGGALARANAPLQGGMLVMTSRISVELVQKAAGMGIAVLAAVSAPTGLALEIAESCGMTLIGVARDDGFEVFTHVHRVCR